MYYFDFEQATYRIRFRHDPTQKMVPRGKKAKEINGETMCIIEYKTGLKTEEGKDAWELVAEGDSQCSIKDQFSRETGRIKSLEHTTEGLGKSFRRACFQALLMPPERE